MKKVLDNFIVLEGLDGSGTTTQLEKIAERFDRDEKAVHATFEPTTSALGKLVRSVLKKDLVTTPLALAMMFAADREDHLNNPVHGITHRLSGGETVICDRYIFSSLAYQSIDCTYDRVSQLNDFPYPAFIFYIDTPTEVCMQRIYRRDVQRELFEEDAYLNKVRQLYEKSFTDLPKEVTFVRIDGSKPIETVTEEIVEILKQYHVL